MLSTNNKTNCFISKAIKIHGDRYDYSNVNYINAKTKINNENKIQNVFICKNNEYHHLSSKI